MTWAYRENPRSPHGKFADYDFSQRIMYDKICGAVKSKIVPDKAFDFMIPSGTAVQNARLRFGDVLNRGDGFHLNGFGRYIAGCMWAKSITDLDIMNLKIPNAAAAGGGEIPTDPNMQEKITQSVNAAFFSPFSSL